MAAFKEAAAARWDSMRRAAATEDEGVVGAGVGVVAVVSTFPVSELVRVEVRDVDVFVVLWVLVRVEDDSPEPLVVRVEVELVVLVEVDSLVRVVFVVVFVSCPAAVSVEDVSVEGISVEGAPTVVALSLPYKSARIMWFLSESKRQVSH